MIIVSINYNDDDDDDGDDDDDDSNDNNANSTTNLRELPARTSSWGCAREVKGLCGSCVRRIRSPNFANFRRRADPGFCITVLPAGTLQNWP